jgi:hypothetical protein
LNFFFVKLFYNLFISYNKMSNWEELMPLYEKYGENGLTELLQTCKIISEERDKISVMDKLPEVSGSIHIECNEEMADIYEVLFDQGLMDDGNTDRLQQNIDTIAPKSTLTEPIICPIQRDNTTDIRTIICGHKFDRKCIEEWFKTNNTCPMCKIKFY